MKPSSNLVVAKAIAVLSVVPILLLASASGPDPRNTGAPGDGNCTACHSGTLNPAGGSISIEVDGGNTYVPGQTKKVQVKFNTTSAVYGFQATARPASNLQNGQAGNLRPVGTDTSVFVQCQNGAELPPSGCPSSAPIQFVQHKQPKTTGSFEFEWVAPATDIGNVQIYAAGNAANNNRANSGDRIYTTSAVLTPSAGGQRPAISQNGVVEAFSNRPLVAGGTWLSIYGTNLSATSREWAGSDFANNIGPTTLDGVKVNIDGKAATVRYVSPGQVNVQAPTNLPVSGPVNVEVVNAAGTSTPASVNVSKTAPVFLAPSTFNVGGRQYVVALYPDFTTFVGREGLVAGASFRPAKPGDTIILYGIGFGPTDPAIPTGQIVAQLNSITSSLRILFGQTQADAEYKGLAPNYVGLYQFNVKVPNVDNGDVQLNVEVDGQRVDQTLYLTVQR